MPFSLIDHDAGAVPLVAVSKSELAAWREAAPAGERDWVAATGFTGEAGKLALIPDAEGRLGRVLIGLPEGEAVMWAFAGTAGDPTITHVSPLDCVGSQSASASCASQFVAASEPLSPSRASTRSGVRIRAMR